MATAIRLMRFGTRNRACYRIIVTDSRNQRDGKYIERLGDYDPLKEKDNTVVDVERAQYWIGQGAQVSETVRSIFKKHGILAPKKV